jgi:hypothetical protein
VGKRKLGDVVAQAKPRTATVRLCLRGDLAQEHERLEGELAEARRYDEQTNEPNTAPAIARRIRDIEAQMRDDEVEFVFSAIGKTRWSDLLAEHPPTKDQKADLRLDHNPETFSVAAIAASLTEPADASLEDVEQLAEVLSVGQWAKLWSACIAANIGGDTPGESSAASAVLRAFEQSSTSAVAAASLAASSSAE